MTEATHRLLTERLLLRQPTTEDAAFLLGLLNEPSFLRFVGDRGVRSEEQAREYLRQGAMASFENNGFGFFVVERREDRAVIGICGLVDRPGLDDVDIGFALLPEHWRKGYAYEAAAAVLEHARSTLELQRIVAITAETNEASIGLLEKLGLHFERLVRLPGEDEDLKLFATPSLPSTHRKSKGTPS